VASSGAVAITLNGEGGVHAVGRVAASVPASVAVGVADTAGGALAVATGFGGAGGAGDDAQAAPTNAAMTSELRIDDSVRGLRSWRNVVAVTHETQSAHKPSSPVRAGERSGVQASPNAMPASAPIARQSMEGTVANME
jgi:hypothetical protein